MIVDRDTPKVLCAVGPKTQFGLGDNIEQLRSTTRTTNFAGQVGSHQDGTVMKPKVYSFVCAELYRGSKGFKKRPYGRPEGPHRYADDQ